MNAEDTIKLKYKEVYSNLIKLKDYHYTHYTSNDIIIVSNRIENR